MHTSLCDDPPAAVSPHARDGMRQRELRCADASTPAANACARDKARMRLKPRSCQAQPRAPIIAVFTRSW